MTMNVELADGEGGPSWPQPRGAVRRLLALKLDLLDFGIALGRKIGGFAALLTLGWTYFRILLLGQSLHDLYPGAPDPDLRQTLWVALLLIMAQGWDIPTDRIARFWHRLRGRLPSGGNPAPSLPGWRAVRARIGPTIVRLGRFMDLSVAIANKIGAFAALCYLLYLAWQFAFDGANAAHLYPAASDPELSLLADLCVLVVVLGWWATPFEQISVFWRRLRAPVEDDAPILPPSP